MSKRNGYSLEGDLKPIFKGEVVLPNVKPIEHDVGAAILHYREMHSGYALLPDGRKEWNARFFLDYGQGGQLYGSGSVAWVAWKDGGYRATGLTFAICEHTNVAGAGANPSRGWHPGVCSKCGLDMTIDSGD
jgi:hypothetical protein